MDQLLQSEQIFDNGLTWTKIETPGYSIKIFINEKEEFFLVSQGPGTIVIYKSTDYGQTFSPLYSVCSKFVTDMQNTFNKQAVFYYIILPGIWNFKSPDLKYL